MNNKKDFEFTIESGKSERHYWMDLWRYRELFYILAWRDIAVRYKQTIMGVLWAVVRPLLTMMIFVIVFGHIAKLPSEGIPYPIFVFAARDCSKFCVSI
jgi:lipopolysaccharide transport system permease protein